jgi:hypothetical protein
VDPTPDSTSAAVIRSEDPRRKSMVLIVNFFDRLERGEVKGGHADRALPILSPAASAAGRRRYHDDASAETLWG